MVPPTLRVVVSVPEVATAVRTIDAALETGLESVARFVTLHMPTPSSSEQRTPRVAFIQGKPGGVGEAAGGVSCGPGALGSKGVAGDALKRVLP